MALRRTFVDVLAAFVALGVFWVPPIVEATGPWRSMAGTVLAAVVGAAMPLRWRFPVVSTASAGAATLAAYALHVCQDPLLATAWCVYPLALAQASRTRPVLLVTISAVGLLAAVTAVPGQSTENSGQRVVIAASAVSVSWLLGTIVGRQIEAVRKAERAHAAEQATRVQLDVARDVHDVVGHALGLITAEAGVTRSLADARERELRDALADIEGHARTALEDIQSLVRSLRAGEAREPAHPAVAAPGFTEFQALVAATRAAGVRVDARIAVPGHLDAAVAAVAYRIVQEALSNVVRHAPGAACVVEIQPQDGVLVARVLDDGPGTKDEESPGFGLSGMRERARLVGGTVAWRSLPSQGFEVEARLPVGDAP
ncbi:sensor histidine kinase [Streptomyces ossamyceticus]|nr:sensor histidine kinase [Streptomyces ossamyceticus]